MSQKHETAFIGSVHRHMAKTRPHREKMCNPYRGGTADVWYSARRDAWIEYKFLPAIPRVVLPDLSPLQAKWCNDRYDEGRQVYVIVGCKEGGVIYRDKTWITELTRDVFRSRLLSRKEIAVFIEGAVL